jgi:hypothetical protein
MALTTVLASKDLSLAYQPLLLASVTFADGTVLRLATHDLRSSTTGVQYGGFDWLPQILNQELAAKQALSSQGHDGIPTVSLKIADADRFLWRTYEQPKGFKGSELVLTFVFMDLATNTFSTDSIVVFRGTCDPANVDEDTMTVRAVSKMDMTKSNLPNVRIQKRMPFPFPTTATQRQAAADNVDSPFYRYGYSPDATGTNARGNNDPATSLPYTTSDYTFEDYLARMGNPTTGDIEHDKLGRRTGTFAGVRWVPPNTFSGKGYIEGKSISGNNTAGNALGDFVPMIYGTAMVQPPVVSILGDPNSTRGEAILCLGKINGILNSEITVNDVRVIASSDIDGNPYHVSDPLVRFDIINRGSRNGSTNKDAIFDGRGDTYGSMATIEWVVYKQVASSSSVPNIRAVVQGPHIPVFTGTTSTSYTLQYTNNPAWVLLDLLIQSGWTYSTIDLQTFIDAAVVCARNINYTDTDGTTSTRPIYQTSLLIRQRKSAASYIRGLRTSFKATLVPNSLNNGLLQLFCDQTLGEQQPSAISGSNYNTAVVSKAHDNSAKNGFVAYDFSDTNGTILRNGKKSSLSISQDNISNSPNRVSFTFQDSENGYQNDTISMVDSADVGRSGQEVNTSLEVEGIGSFDHAQRIGAFWLASHNKGNPRNDSGGTLRFSWETNFKALHLRVGHIVRFSSTHDNISNQLLRITKVTPSTNFATVKIEAAWHSDEWYLDSFGQSGYVSLSNPARGRLDRPPFPWLPNQITGLSSDPFFSTSNFTFDLAQEYGTAADGSSIVNLLVKGKIPVNTFSTAVHPPLIRPAASTTGTGGTLTGNRTYSLAVCAKDTNGLYSGPSDLVNVQVPTGTNTNTVTLTDLTWDSSTDGYALFAGTDPNLMCFQSETTGTPSTIALNSLSDRTWGLPDIEFDRLKAKVKKVIHGGVIGQNILSATTSTITIPAGTWTTNEWAGRTATFVGNIADLSTLPVANYTIVSNTNDTLTVTGDPTAAGIGVNDILLIRTLATTHTATTIGDALFVNSTYPSGMTVDGEIGHRVRIIAGTGAGQVATIVSNTSTVLTIDGSFNPVPDGTSVFNIEEATWIEDYQTNPLNNSANDSGITMRLRVDNFLNTLLLVQVLTVDGNGKESLEAKSAWREIWLYGDVTTGAVDTIPLLGWQDALNALPQDY